MRPATEASTRRPEFDDFTRHLYDDAETTIIDRVDEVAEPLGTS